ncbi:MAG: GNAT family N-acetyltransferase [Candidatus Omnitrophota bacterium]
MFITLKQSNNIARRLVSVILIASFLFTNSDLSLAREIFSDRTTLSPASRFNPLAKIREKDDGTFDIVRDEEGRRDLKDGFKADAEFLYLSRLIGDALGDAVRMKLTYEGLRILIERDLRDTKTEFEHFDPARLYRRDDSYYLPYKSALTGGDLLLRYFVSSTGHKFPDAVKVADLGEGDFVWMETISADGIEASAPNAVLLKRPVDIIDPGEIKTGRDLVRIIDEVLRAPHPAEALQAACHSLAITGHAILAGYEEYLNDEGLGVKNAFSDMLRKVESGKLVWTKDDFGEFKKLVKKIPTIDDPNEDLFVDVLTDFTPDMIRLLANSGYDHSFNLQLTKGCGNQCLICGVSKARGAMHHIPFPIAAKLLRKVNRYQSKLMPYFDSDALHYRDSVVNATYADIVSFARRSGFTWVPTVTHGIGGAKAKGSGDIVREARNYLTISVHVYHHPVMEYVKSKLEGKMTDEALAKRRESIINMYADRFVYLIQGAIDSGKGFQIRLFRPNPDVEYMLQRHLYAYAAVKEIQAIQDEVWSRVKGRIPLDMDRTSDTHVVWIDDAARFLKDLGVPEDIIANTQKAYDDNIYNGASIVGDHYSLIAGPDGSVTMQVREGNNLRFRTVGEMFEGPASEGFGSFVQALKIISSFDYDNPKSSRNSYVSSAKMKDIGTDIEGLILRELRKEIARNPYSDEEVAEKVKEITVYRTMGDFYKLLFSFYLNQDEIRRLSHDPTEGGAALLYQRLKDVPFPVKMEFNIVMQDNELCVFSYSPMDAGRPGFEKDLYNSTRRFELPVRAFASRSEAAQRPPFPGHGPGSPHITQGPDEPAPLISRVDELWGDRPVRVRKIIAAILGDMRGPLTAISVRQAAGNILRDNLMNAKARQGAVDAITFRKWISRTGLISDLLAPADIGESDVAEIFLRHGLKFDRDLRRRLCGPFRDEISLIKKAMNALQEAYDPLLSDTSPDERSKQEFEEKYEFRAYEKGTSFVPVLGILWAVRDQDVVSISYRIANRIADDYRKARKAGRESIFPLIRNTRIRARLLERTAVDIPLAIHIFNDELDSRERGFFLGLIREYFGGEMVSAVSAVMSGRGMDDAVALAGRDRQFIIFSINFFLKSVFFYKSVDMGQLEKLIPDIPVNMGYEDILTAGIRERFSSIGPGTAWAETPEAGGLIGTFGRVNPETAFVPIGKFWPRDRIAYLTEDNSFALMRRRGGHAGYAGVAVDEEDRELLSEGGAVIPGTSTDGSRFVLIQRMIPVGERKVFAWKLKERGISAYSLPLGFITIERDGRRYRDYYPHLDCCLNVIARDFTEDGRVKILIDPLYYKSVKDDPEFRRLLREQGFLPDDVIIISEEDSGLNLANFAETISGDGRRILIFNAGAASTLSRIPLKAGSYEELPEPLYLLAQSGGLQRCASNLFPREEVPLPGAPSYKVDGTAFPPDVIEAIYRSFSDDGRFSRFLEAFRKCGIEIVQITANRYSDKTEALKTMLPYEAAIYVAPREGTEEVLNEILKGFEVILADLRSNWGGIIIDAGPDGENGIRERPPFPGHGPGTPHIAQGPDEPEDLLSPEPQAPGSKPITDAERLNKLDRKLSYIALGVSVPAFLAMLAGIMMGSDIGVAIVGVSSIIGSAALGTTALLRVKWILEPGERKETGGTTPVRVDITEERSERIEVTIERVPGEESEIHIVAKDPEGKEAGRATYMIRSEDAIQLLSIDVFESKKRRSGIGEQLMLRIKDEMVEAGRSEIFLFCLQSNAGAIRFYDKMGERLGMAMTKEDAIFHDQPPAAYKITYRITNDKRQKTNNGNPARNSGPDTITIKPVPPGTFPDLDARGTPQDRPGDQEKRRAQQQKLAVQLLQKEFARKEALVKYGIYTAAELAVVEGLYRRFAVGEDLSHFSPYEKVFIWQYMILMDMHSSSFRMLEEEVNRLAEDLEIDGLYVGFEWNDHMAPEDKVRTVENNISIRPGMRMLDIGCGKGSVIIELARRHAGVEFIGIDANPRNISNALTRLMEMGPEAPRNVRFHMLDCREPVADKAIPRRGIPYGEGAFDVISLMEGVFDEAHSSDSAERLLWREAIRVAGKDGGIVAFFGLAGKNKFEESLPEGVYAEMKDNTFFSIGGRNTRYYFPSWTREDEPSPYRREKTEFCVWRLALRHGEELPGHQVTMSPVASGLQTETAPGPSQPVQQDLPFETEGTPPPASDPSSGRRTQGNFGPGAMNVDEPLGRTSPLSEHAQETLFTARLHFSGEGFTAEDLLGKVASSGTGRILSDLDELERNGYIEAVGSGKTPGFRLTAEATFALITMEYNLSPIYIGELGRRGVDLPADIDNPDELASHIIEFTKGDARIDAKTTLHMILDLTNLLEWEYVYLQALEMKKAGKNWALIDTVGLEEALDKLRPLVSRRLLEVQDLEVGWIGHGLEAARTPPETDDFQKAASLVNRYVTGGLAAGEEELKEIHSVVSEHLKVFSAGRSRNVRRGEYRAYEDAYRDLTYFPLAEKVPDAMAAVFRLIKVPEFMGLHPVEQAAITFYLIHNIQPFDNGNTRTASLFMDCLLMKNNYPPFVISEYNERRFHEVIKFMRRPEPERFNEGSMTQSEFVNDPMKLLGSPDALAKIRRYAREFTAFLAEETARELVLQPPSPGSQTQGSPGHQVTRSPVRGDEGRLAEEAASASGTPDLSGYEPRWVTGVKEVGSDPAGPYEIFIDHGRNYGNYTDVNEALYNGKRYMAKWVSGHGEREGLIASQARVLNYLKDVLSDADLARISMPEYIQLEDGTRMLLFEKFTAGSTMNDIMESGFLALSNKRASLLRAVREIACAVKALHDVNVYHGDITLKNVWVFEDGRIKLFDFDFATMGTAGLRQRGLNLWFVSPERLERAFGKKEATIDKKAAVTDEVCSIGVIMTAVLTGELLFNHVVTGEKAGRKRPMRYDPRTALNAVGVPGRIVEVAVRALADSKDRFQTVDELIRALDGSETPSEPIGKTSPDAGKETFPKDPEPVSGTPETAALRDAIEAAIPQGIGFYKKRNPGQPDETTRRKIDEQNSLAEPLLTRTIERLRAHYPDIAEMLADLYPRVLPYYIAGMDVNYIQHHATVIDFASEIAVGERLDEKESAILILAALFHDSGNGLTTLSKVTATAVHNMPVTTPGERAAREGVIEQAVAFRKEHMEIGAGIVREIIEPYRARAPDILPGEDVSEIERLVLHHDDLKIPLWQENVDTTWLTAKDDRSLQFLMEADALWMLTPLGIRSDIDKSEGEPLSPSAQASFNVGLFRKWKELYDRAFDAETVNGYGFRDGTLLRSHAAYLIYQRLIEEAANDPENVPGRRTTPGNLGPGAMNIDEPFEARGPGPAPKTADRRPADTDFVEKVLDTQISMHGLQRLFDEGLLDKRIALAWYRALVSKGGLTDKELSDEIDGEMDYMPPDELYGALKDRGLNPKNRIVAIEADRVLKGYFDHLRREHGIVLPYGYLSIEDNVVFMPKRKLKRYYDAPKAVTDSFLHKVIISNEFKGKELLTYLIHEGLHLNAVGFYLQGVGGMRGSHLNEGMAEYLTRDAMEFMGVDGGSGLWRKTTAEWKVKAVRIVESMIRYMGERSTLIRAFFNGGIDTLPIIPMTLAKAVIKEKTQVYYDGNKMPFSAARRVIREKTPKDIPDDEIYILAEHDRNGYMLISRYTAAEGNEKGPGLQIVLSSIGVIPEDAPALLSVEAVTGYRALDMSDSMSLLEFFTALERATRTASESDLFFAAGKWESLKASVTAPTLSRVVLEITPYIERGLSLAMERCKAAKREKDDHLSAEAEFDDTADMDEDELAEHFAEKALNGEMPKGLENIFEPQDDDEGGSASDVTVRTASYWRTTPGNLGPGAMNIDEPFGSHKDGPLSIEEAVKRIEALLEDAPRQRSISTKEAVTNVLMSIARDGEFVFNRKQANRVASVRRFGDKLPLLKFLVTYKIKTEDGDRYVFNGGHVAIISPSSRTNQDAERLIVALKDMGITEGAHLAIITASSRSEDEIKKIVPFLRAHGITANSHIASILKSSRDEAEIGGLVSFLGDLGITEPAHITRILTTSRGRKEIEGMVTMLKGLGIVKGAHISYIVQTSRTEAEVKNLIDFLDGLGIRGGFAVASIVHSAREKDDISAIIETLRAAGITEDAHIAMILMSKRTGDEIAGILAKLKKHKIADGVSCSIILRSSRKEEDIEGIVKALKKCGMKSIHIALVISASRTKDQIEKAIRSLALYEIKNPSHIASILACSRSNKEIRMLVSMLVACGITDGAHIALIASTKRSTSEVRRLTGHLRRSGITHPFHIAAIIQSSRPEQGIMSLIEMLKASGITGGASIAMISGSSRSEAEISSVVSSVRSLGIVNSCNIATVVASSRKEEDIERLIRSFRRAGFEEPAHISLMIHSSRTEGEIAEIIAGLDAINISEHSAVARIIHSSRSKAEIEDLVKLLVENNIEKDGHIARIIGSSRPKVEVRSIIKTLKALGIVKPFDMAFIIQGKRSEDDIKEIISMLRKHGINKGFHIAVAIHCSRPKEGIERLLKTLAGQGITGGLDTALVIRSTRDEKEIPDIIETLKAAGIRKSFYLAEVLASSRTKSEIREIVRTLKALGITDAGSIAIVLKGSRSKKAINEMVPVLKAAGFSDERDLAHILLSGRTLAEINVTVSRLKACGIIKSSHIAHLLRTDRPIEEMERIIASLRDSGIRDASAMTRILMGGRSASEIKGLISELCSVSITTPKNIAVIARSDRSTKEMKELVGILNAAGIRDETAVTRIIACDRSNNEIRSVIPALRSLGITKEFHMAMVISTSRTVEDIKKVVEAARSSGINESFHLALVAGSSRRLSDIEGLFRSLEAEGITDQYHKACVVHSERTNAEISSGIALLKSIGVKAPAKIARLLSTSHSDEEFRSTVTLLEGVGITDINRIISILELRRPPAEVGDAFELLRQAGITDNTMSFPIIKRRSAEEIEGIVSLLKYKGIVNTGEIAIVLRSKRSREEIEITLKMLQRFGISESVPRALIIKSRHTAREIEDLIPALRQAGITRSAQIAGILYGEGSKEEIEEKITQKTLPEKEKAAPAPAEVMAQDMAEEMSAQEETMVAPEPVGVSKGKRVMPTLYKTLQSVGLLPKDAARLPADIEKRYSALSITDSMLFLKFFTIMKRVIAQYADGREEAPDEDVFVVASEAWRNIGAIKAGSDVHAIAQSIKGPAEDALAAAMRAIEKAREETARKNLMEERATEEEDEDVLAEQFAESALRGEVPEDLEEALEEVRGELTEQSSAEVLPEPDSELSMEESDAPSAGRTTPGNLGPGAMNIDEPFEAQGPQPTAQSPELPVPDSGLQARPFADVTVTPVVGEAAGVTLRGLYSIPAIPDETTAQPFFSVIMHERYYKEFTEKVVDFLRALEESMNTPKETREEKSKVLQKKYSLHDAMTKSLHKWAEYTLQNTNADGPLYAPGKGFSLYAIILACNTISDFYPQFTHIKPEEWLCYEIASYGKLPLNEKNRNILIKANGYLERVLADEDRTNQICRDLYGEDYRVINLVLKWLGNIAEITAHPAERNKARNFLTYFIKQLLRENRDILEAFASFVFDRFEKAKKQRSGSEENHGIKIAIVLTGAEHLGQWLRIKSKLLGKEIAFQDLSLTLSMFMHLEYINDAGDSGSYILGQSSKESLKQSLHEIGITPSDTRHLILVDTGFEGSINKYIVYPLKEMGVSEELLLLFRKDERSVNTYGFNQEQGWEGSEKRLRKLAHIIDDGFEASTLSPTQFSDITDKKLASTQRPWFCELIKREIELFAYTTSEGLSATQPDIAEDDLVGAAPLTARPFALFPAAGATAEVSTTPAGGVPQSDVSQTVQQIAPETFSGPIGKASPDAGEDTFPKDSEAVSVANEEQEGLIQLYRRLYPVVFEFADQAGIVTGDKVVVIGTHVDWQCGIACALKGADVISIGLESDEDEREFKAADEVRESIEKNGGQYRIMRPYDYLKVPVPESSIKIIVAQNVIDDPEANSPAIVRKMLRDVQDGGYIAVSFLCDEQIWYTNIKRQAERLGFILQESVFADFTGMSGTSYIFRVIKNAPGLTAQSSQPTAQSPVLQAQGSPVTSHQSPVQERGQTPSALSSASAETLEAKSGISKVMLWRRDSTGEGGVVEAADDEIRETAQEIAAGKYKFTYLITGNILSLGIVEDDKKTHHDKVKKPNIEDRPLKGDKMDGQFLILPWEIERRTYAEWREQYIRFARFLIEQGILASEPLQVALKASGVIPKIFEPDPMPETLGELANMSLSNEIAPSSQLPTPNSILQAPSPNLTLQAQESTVHGPRSTKGAPVVVEDKEYGVTLLDDYYTYLPRETYGLSLLGTKVGISNTRYAVVRLKDTTINVATHHSAGYIFPVMAAKDGLINGDEVLLHIDFARHPDDADLILSPPPLGNDIGEHLAFLGPYKDKGFLGPENYLTALKKAFPDLVPVFLKDEDDGHYSWGGIEWAYQGSVIDFLAQIQDKTGGARFPWLARGKIASIDLDIFRCLKDDTTKTEQLLDAIADVAAPAKLIMIFTSPGYLDKEFAITLAERLVEKIARNLQDLAGNDRDVSVNGEGRGQGSQVLVKDIQKRGQTPSTEEHLTRLDNVYFGAFPYNGDTSYVKNEESHVRVPRSRPGRGDMLVDVNSATIFEYGLIESKIKTSPLKVMVSDETDGKVANCHQGEAILIKTENANDVLGTLFLEECDAIGGRTVIKGEPYLFLYHKNDSFRNKSFSTFVQWLLKMSDSVQDLECCISMRRGLDERCAAEYENFQETIADLSSLYPGVRVHAVRSRQEPGLFGSMVVSKYGVTCRTAKYTGRTRRDDATADWANAEVAMVPFAVGSSPKTQEPVFGAHDAQTPNSQPPTPNLTLQAPNSKLQANWPVRLVDTIKIRAMEAKEEGQKLIVGVGTSWIPGYAEQGEEHNGLNPILSELRNLRALDNIVFVDAPDNELAQELIKKADGSKTDYKNVIVLADNKFVSGELKASTEIEKAALDGFRSLANGSAFLAGVDTANFTTVSYRPQIDLLEMLAVAIALSSDKELMTDSEIEKRLGFRRINKRMIVYLPEAHPINTEEYRFQLVALQNA